MVSALPTPSAYPRGHHTVFSTWMAFCIVSLLQSIFWPPGCSGSWCHRSNLYLERPESWWINMLTSSAFRNNSEARCTQGLGTESQVPQQWLTHYPTLGWLGSLLSTAFSLPYWYFLMLPPQINNLNPYFSLRVSFSGEPKVRPQKTHLY